MPHPTRSYLAECFWPGVTSADLEALHERAADCSGASSSVGCEVAYLGSILMAEDEVVLCFFRAFSAESVKGAARRAEIPFERVVESTWFPRKPARRAGAVTTTAIKKATTDEKRDEGLSGR